MSTLQRDMAAVASSDAEPEERAYGPGPGHLVANEEDEQIKRSVEEELEAGAGAGAGESAAGVEGAPSSVTLRKFVKEHRTPSMRVRSE